MDSDAHYRQQLRGMQQVSREDLARFQRASLAPVSPEDLARAQAKAMKNVWHPNYAGISHDLEMQYRSSEGADQIEPRNHADTGGARNFFFFALVLAGCAAAYCFGWWIGS